jgi:hypothetical protein
VSGDASVAETIESICRSFADATYRRMLHDVCVAFADRRVLDGVLALIFARQAGQDAIATGIALTNEWVKVYPDDDGTLDPPGFTGLPMRLHWDYFGAELFPDGHWDFETWQHMMGYATLPD